MERKRILIVAAKLGYQTRRFVEAAERAGLEPVLATDRCGGMDDPWGDHALAVKFSRPEAAGRRIKAEIRDVAGVVAVGDRPALAAAHAARRLGLRFHSPKAVEAARNKYLARERWRAAGLPVPAYFRVPAEADAREAAGRAPYPCVLKPLGLSGSRGVIRADSEAEFAAAFERIKAILERPVVRLMKDEADRFIQVEEYIPGREYALECLVRDGRLRVLAIFDKPDPLEGPFFEETVYVTPSRARRKMREAMIESLERGVAALGLRDGPVHAELRLNERGAWLLETAPRPIGGLCAKALTFDGGMELEEVILREAAGLPYGPLTLDGPASGVMMIPIPRNGIYQGVRGVERAVRVAGVTGVEITAAPGQTLEQLPEGAAYLGFLFARGPSPGRVEASLGWAHAALEFEIYGTLPVLGNPAAL